MKKIVLANLCSDETKAIQKIETMVATFQTLYNNIFLDSKEKEKIAEQYKLLCSERGKIYKNIISKYKLPIVLRNRLLISYDTNELYINVTGE